MKTDLVLADQLLRFDEFGESDLVRALADLEQQTGLYMIQHLEQVLFGPDGRTLSGMRYTLGGLRQVCAWAGRGLAQLITSLAGLSELTNDPSPGSVDQMAAIDVFNRVVRARFPLVCGRQMVYHRSRNTIDGVVGPDYRYLSNAGVHGLVREQLHSLVKPVQLFEAKLEGRRLSAYYRNVEPVFEIVSSECRTGEPFFGGVHYGNSEVGDCSVHAGVLLLRQICDNKAIGEAYDGHRVTHCGNKFWRNVSRLLDGVVRRVDDLHTLKPQILRLMDLSLGLTGVAVECDSKRSDEIVSKLRQRGVLQGVARASLSRALEEGSFRSYAPWPHRTAYDLFNALTTEAKSLAIEDSERVECVAYELLTNKFQV